MKSNLRLSPLIACLACVGILASLPQIATAAPGDAVEMKPRWAVGHRYDMRVSTIQNMEISLPNGPGPVKSQTKMSQDFAFTATKALDNGGRELQMVVQSMAVNTSSSGRPAFNYDSKTDTASTNPAAAMFRKIIGAQVIILTDADGKVEKVQGVQQLLDRISQGSPQTKTLLQGLLSEDTLKQMGGFNEGLPPKAVKVGDTWPAKMEIPAGPGGKLEISLKCSFKTWEQHEGHNCALLLFTGDITSKPGENAGAPGSFAVQSGKMSGKLWFDPAIGMVVDSLADQDMTLKINAANQTLTSTISQRVQKQLIKMTPSK